MSFEYVTKQVYRLTEATTGFKAVTSLFFKTSPERLCGLFHAVALVATSRIAQTYLHRNLNEIKKKKTCKPILRKRVTRF